jgi:transposase
MLAPIDFLEASLAHLQEEIEGMLQPFEEAITLAQTLPGVGPVAAAVLIAEIGIDMSAFPTHQHLASWAGVCPACVQATRPSVTEAVISRHVDKTVRLDGRSRTNG